FTLFSSLLRRALRSALFPYTTLFRSDSRFEADGGLSNRRVAGGGRTNARGDLDRRSVASGGNGGRRSCDAGGERLAGARPSSCLDRKSTRLNSSHLGISYAVFCLKKK